MNNRRARKSNDLTNADVHRLCQRSNRHFMINFYDRSFTLGAIHNRLKEDFHSDANDASQYWLGISCWFSLISKRSDGKRDAETNKQAQASIYGDCVDGKDASRVSIARWSLKICWEVDEWSYLEKREKCFYCWSIRWIYFEKIRLHEFGANTIDRYECILENYTKIRACGWTRSSVNQGMNWEKIGGEREQTYVWL